MIKDIRKNLWVFIALLVAALLFYVRTAGAGFVTDQLGWLEQYNIQGWKGIFVAFHDNALHYIYHLAGFVLWKLFKFNGYAWMFVFVFLHALIALFSYLVFKKIYSHAGIKQASAIALAGSFIFLLSPYQTEPLCWYACIHYPTSVLLVLISLYNFIVYLESGNRKNIFLFYLFYIIAVFTLEITFSFPLIIGVFIFFFPLDTFKENNRLKLFTRFVFPSLACVAAYFLFNKLLVGTVAGHYGSKVHFNFSIPLLVGDLMKHSTKIFLFTQYLSFQQREAVYSFESKVKLIYVVFILLVMAGLLAVIFRNKIPVRWKITGMLFAFFILGLSIILNLYFYDTTRVENDRFEYFAMIFAAQLIVFFAVTFLKKAGWLLVAVYFLTGCWFLYVNTENWKLNKEIRDSMEQDFRWYNAKKVYILNVPDNFRGTYMYRDYKPGNSFAETIELKTGKKLIDKTDIVCEFNMEQLTDSVKVVRLPRDSVKVLFGQYGNWWWEGGVGAPDFLSDAYDMHIGQWDDNYIYFKHLQPGDVIIYQVGEKWKEFKWK